MYNIGIENVLLNSNSSHDLETYRDIFGICWFSVRSNMEVHTDIC